jgi:hypothetical protein
MYSESSWFPAHAKKVASCPDGNRMRDRARRRRKGCQPVTNARAGGRCPSGGSVAPLFLHSLFPARRRQGGKRTSPFDPSVGFGAPLNGKKREARQGARAKMKGFSPVARSFSVGGKGGISVLEARSAAPCRASCSGHKRRDEANGWPDAELEKSNSGSQSLRMRNGWQ